ncbi:MAG TPA: hypothetical protein P5531_14445 [Bacteroidales bacterium]|nr:hypothetical protein [Bacteroidales bacterium]HSA44763.1 hypothetical protein [Bacteroidales bacterium]
MKKTFACLLFSCLTVLSLKAQPVSGTRTIGPGGDYLTLTAAFSAINANGLGGPVILSLISGYSPASEVFPLSPPITGTAINTITIRPAVSGLNITSGNAGPTFDLDSVRYFILDGRVGGTGSTRDLVVSNTNTGGIACRFINGGSHNILRYCTFRGVNTLDTCGVIVFSTSTLTSGNNNNLIEFCDIRDGASTPRYGIYSAGIPGAENNNNTVTSCNIYNFYHAAANFSGIFLASHSGDWLISNNHFYQTTSRATTNGQFMSCMELNQGTSLGNLTVTNNYIGGQAPFCGGSPMTLTGSGGFRMIRVGVKPAALASVQGNTIRNISLTTGSTQTSISGIAIVNGNVSCGNVTPNIIGDVNNPSSISITSTNTMIFSCITSTAGNLGDILISGNIMAGVAMNGSAGAGLRGIYITGTPNSLIISNNQVGAQSGPLTSTCNGMVVGVYSLALTLNQAIFSNTVRYLSATNTGSSNQLVGIRLSPASAGNGQIHDNLVSDLVSSCSSTGNEANCAVIGILSNAAITEGQQIFGNTIHSLSNISPLNAVKVAGIYYDGPVSGSNLISGNLIHSLSVSSSSLSSAIYGILMKNGNGSAGSVSIRNNMIGLGIDAAGNSITLTPVIYGLAKTGSNGRIFACHNSIFVGGSGVGSGTANSFAFYRTGTAIDTLVNNIFSNQRSNATAGSGGKHYACFFTNTTNHFSDYNVLTSSGNDGVTMTFNSGTTPLNNLQAIWEALPGQNLHSGIGDPNYLNPAGSASTINMHLGLNTPAEGSGLSVNGVILDIDGEIRNSLTPVDIGADAGNYVNVDIFHPVITFEDFTDGAIAATRTVGDIYITDQGTGVDLNPGSRPRIYYRKQGDASLVDYTNTPGVSGWKWVEASNAISPFTFTINYAFLAAGSVSAGDVIEYFFVAQDQAVPLHLGFNPLAGTSGTTVGNLTTLPVTPKSYAIKQTISGIKYIGGATPDYPNLTGPAGLFQDINANVVTGNITAIIAGDLLEDGTHALNQWTENDLPPVFTLTIQPDGPALRTVSNNGNLTGVYMIRFSGADRVTINGGAGKNLLFRNTHLNPADARSPLQFLGDAVQCTLTNTVVETNSSWAACVNLGAGGSSVNITACELRGATGGVAGPAKQGVYAASASTYLNVTDCNIHHFTHEGIMLYDCGDNCVISANNIYAGAATAEEQSGIRVESGSGHVISANYIGGSAPGCEGGYWEYAGNSVFAGIWINTAGTQLHHIFGNAVSNISITATGNVFFAGIFCENGLVNIGTLGGNLIGHPSLPNSILSSGTGGNFGIWLNNDQWQSKVENNLIANMSLNNPLSQGYLTGILVSAGSVCRNKIFGLRGLVGTVAVNITGVYHLSKSGSTNNLYNNMISLNAGVSMSPNLFGLDLTGLPDAQMNCYYNSVRVFGPVSTANYTSAMRCLSEFPCDIRNNLFINEKAPGNNRPHYAVYCIAPDSFISDYNVIYSFSGPCAWWNGGPVQSFAAYQAASGQDQHSISIKPYFASDTDLHLLPFSNCFIDGAGIPLPGINTDYDLNLRDAATPDPGYDEFVSIPPSTPVSGGNQDGCEGGVIPSLSATGSGTIKWFGNPGLTNLLFRGNPFPSGQSTAGTYTYYAVDSVTGCESQPVTITLTIHPPAVGGQVNGSTILCIGENTGTLTLSGHTGTLVKWQYTTAPFSTWTDIPNTGTTYSPGILAQTTWFRAVLASGPCPYVYSGHAVVTVNPLPNVSFAGVLPAQCVNNTTFNLQTGFPVGGTYSGPGVTGTNFSAAAAGAGTWIITYTYADANNCSSSATNSITVYDLPAVTFTGSLQVPCLNDPAFVLSGGNPPGGIYFGPGVNGYIFTPAVAGAGTHSITYQFTDSHNCTSAALNTITVNEVPVVHAVTGSGNYCQGESGLEVVLTGSQIGVNYQLMKNGSPFGSVVQGTGNPIGWPGMTAGTYTVNAVFPLTSCGLAMSDQALITENPLPQVFNLAGSGSYCHSGNGRTVSLEQSSTGVSYQLLKDNVPDGDPLFGSGGPLEWLHKTAGTYTVLATIISTGCSTMMNGLAVITQDPALSASVIPDPAYLVAGGSLNLNGNPSGGSPPYTLHQWTGAGASALNNTGILNPVFSQNTVGDYLLVYTVTDQHSCTATDQLTVHVVSTLLPPAMEDVIRCGSGTVLMTAVAGPGGDQVQFSLDGINPVYTDDAEPYEYTTPAVLIGSPLTVFARTRNSVSSVVSLWISATATAYASSVGGSLSGAAMLCLGQSTPVMYLAGQTGNIIRWQKRLNGGSWQTIVLTDDFYQETPSSSGLWEYRVEVQIPSCAVAYSNVVPVQVYPLSAGGQLSGGNTSICYGSATGLLTLTGYTGNVQRWQRRFNGFAWENIVHTGNTYSEIPSSAGTWDYRAEVRSGTCDPVYSDFFTITVISSSQGGFISGGGTICPQTPIPLLVLSGYNGTILRWQKRLNGTSWTDINHNLSTYSEIPLFSGVWDYRAEIGNGVCPPVFSALATVTVYPVSLGGNVTGSGAVCLGNSTGTLTLVNYSNNILRWEKRFNGGNWIPIVHLQNTYSEIPLQSGTWEYRAVCGISTCGEAFSSPAVIQVNPSSAGGAVSGNNEICQGENSGLLTLSGHSGNVIRWQFAVSPFTNWMNINHTGLTYTSGPLTQNTKFRAVVQLGTCPEAFSLDAVITVNPLPVVGFPGIFPDQCINGQPFTLTGGTPAGGTYSGNGVNGTTFDPVAAGPGSHMITYTYTDGNGCSASASNTVSVFSLPEVTFGGSLPELCTGSATLSLSGGQPAGGTYSGPGVTQGNFNPSIAGPGLHVLTYTFTDVHACSNNAANMITVVPDPDIFSLSGGGSCCEGGGGMEVILASSQTGVSYQLLLNDNPLGSILPGTGGSITWSGLGQGTYAVQATLNSPSCSVMMAGSPVVVVNPRPVLFNVTGGGNYCEDADGQTITLDGSETGIGYQLMKDASPLGSPVFGNGNPITWPGNTTGTYTVIATNPLTSCFRMMNGSAIAAQDPAISAGITPDPAMVTVGVNLNMNANPAGGTLPYVSHQWTGTGSAYLDAVNVQSPVFNCPAAGSYLLTYTVTDAHGCTAVDQVEIQVTSVVAEPSMNDQVRCGEGSVEMVAVAGSGGDQVQFSLDGLVVVFTDWEAPFSYITPSIPAGTTLIVYARTRNSATGETSTWITAQAMASENSVGGSVTGGSEICLGNPGPVLNLTGQTGNVISWQKRLNSGAWTTIIHTGTSYSETPAVDGNWEYRAQVQISGCPDVFSAAAMVVVHPLPLGGSLSGGLPEICLGNSTGTIILTGHSGTIAFWRKRLNAGAWQQTSHTGISYSEIPVQPGLWEYQVVLGSGNCPQAVSGIQSVQVTAWPLGGSVTGSASICPGVNTPVMTLAGYAGNIMKWQKRLDGGVWEDIPLTQPFYSEIPAGSGIWEYRAVVNQGSCDPAYALPAAIQVFPLPQQGTVIGGGTVCLGESTGILQCSGFNGTISRWQKRLNTGPWTDIPHTLATYSEVPSQYGTWQYRAVTVIASCSESFSSAASVNVSLPGTGGSVTPDQLICQGEEATALALAGFTGQILYWESSVSPFTDWTLIPFTGNMYDPGLLDLTTRFRAVVQNEPCTAVTSAWATITVEIPPLVTFQGNLPVQCLDAPPFPLSGGDPPGGIYSGPGVQSGMFIPSAGGIGTHVISYTYDAGGVCTGSADNTIAVVPLPLVTWDNELPACCLNTEPFELTGGLPAGGTYTGPGAVGSTFYPAIAGAGNHLLTYSYIDVNGCDQSTVNSIAVNPMPLTWPVTGSGSYCEGAPGLSVQLMGSQTGFSYQLFRDGLAYGNPVSGTGSMLSWDNLDGGIYTVLSADPSTGCSLPMTGEVMISVNPLPQIFELSGSGHYCHSSPGLPVYLSGSEANVSYQLLKDNLSFGLPVAGTGGPISWENCPFGSYTVTATRFFTACSQQMTTTVTITRDPEFTAHVDPDPAYCGQGWWIQLHGTQSGGTPPYVSTVFTGPGAQYLTSTDYAEPFFTWPPYGDFDLTYTVTDTHGCEAVFDFTVHVVSLVGNPVMNDTVHCGGGPFDLSAQPGTLGNGVQFSWDMEHLAFTDLTSPYLFHIPYLPSGANLTCYVRTIQTSTGIVGPWQPVHITSFPAPVPGWISGSDTICIGEGTGAMAIQEHQGYVQKWQKRLDGGVWEDIPNLLESYAETPAIPGLWEYRAEIMLGGCALAYSTPAVIHVFPESDGGNIQNFTTAICQGESTGPIIVGGFTGTIKHWRKRYYTTAWQMIPHTDTVYSEIPADTGVWEYQVVVQSGVCDEDYSSSVFYIVNPGSVGGTVSGGAPVCEGSYTPVLTLSNHTGFITGWQKRLNDGPWMNIVNTADWYSEIPAQPGTWQYRAQVQSGYCPSAISNPATVLVASANNGGQIAGGGNICLGSSTGYLILSGYNGSIVKWQRKHENGPWTDIIFVQHIYTSTPTLPGMWYYRAVINHAVCGITYSSVAQVLVASPSVGGAVTGGSAICQGGSTDELTLAGHTGSVVKWQKRHNNGNWQDIQHSNLTLTQMISQPGIWDYRAVVQNGACGQSYSAFTSVTVSAISIAGNVSGSTAFCLGNPTGTLQLSGYNGTILRWQKRVNGGNWIDITNTATIYSEIPGSAGFWEYRAVVQNGSCSEAFSSPAVINVYAIPLVFYFSGPAMYCDGSGGVTLSLSGSETGVAYQLYKNGVSLNFPLQGNGQMLQWQGMTAGTYQVHATQTTTNCNIAMNGTVNVSAQPLPEVYAFGSSGVDCGGQGGGVVVLSNSQPGIVYQLMLNNVPVFSPIYGVGQEITWTGLPAGNYSIQAVNPGSGCSSWMNGTANVSFVPLPQIFTVTGGGDACANGTGVPVGLSDSQLGITYRLLWNGLYLSGYELTGTGQAISFGNLNQPGYFQVEATDPLSLCSGMMDQIVWINLFDSPLVFAGPDLNSLFGSGVSLSASVSGGTPPYTLIWSPGDGLSNTNTLNPFANPSDTTVYTLQVTDANGCTAADEVTVYPFLPAGQSVVFGSVKYDNNQHTPLQNVNVYLKTSSGQLISQTTTGSDGTYQFPAFPDGTYILTAGSNQPVGGINSTDGLEALKHFVHIINLQGIRREAADVDASNFVNAVDALAIQRFFVGILSSFPSGPWAFEDPLLTFSGSIAEHNLLGLCYGDDNGSFIPYAKSRSAVSCLVEGSFPASAGEQIQLPLIIRAGQPAAAVSIDLSFNDAVFMPESIVFPSGEEGWIWNVEDKRLRLSGIGLEGLQREGSDLLILLNGKRGGDPVSEWIVGAEGEVSSLDALPLETVLVFPSLPLGNDDGKAVAEIFPNPARDKIWVKAYLPEPATLSFMISNPEGRPVAAASFAGREGWVSEALDVSPLAPGLYLLQIRFSGGQYPFVVNQKIIILP